MEEIVPSGGQQGDISVENAAVISHAISESSELKDDCVNKPNVCDKSTDDGFRDKNIDSECQNSIKVDDEELLCVGDKISTGQPNAGHDGKRDVSECSASPANADSLMAQADGDGDPEPPKPTAEEESPPPPVAMESSDKEPDAEKVASGAEHSSGEPSSDALILLPDELGGKVGPDGDGGASGQDSAGTESPAKPHTDSGKASEVLMDTAAAGTSEETAIKDGSEPKPDAMEIDSQKEEASGGAVVQGATAALPTSPSACSEKAPIQSVYHVKWIKFKGETLPIVTQNENGPCPLLAIMNVLLLQQRVRFPAMIEMVTSGQLLDYLGDCILEHAPENISEDTRLNYEQNMHDAMAVFHKLQTGLDVNVRFTGISDFEYTPECIVFDLLSIPLYHGWLVDPESPETVAALGTCSYNQLVEKIIEQKNHQREELMHEALMAEEFLERTASQLTYHGLHELVTTLKEEELAVFFRNNHFSTLLKHKNELFHLVTDQGFLTESNVVWETLSNVEGDGNFVDMDFRTFTKPEPILEPLGPPVVPANTDQQIDQDYLVALSLQQEQNTVVQAEEPRQTPTPQPQAALSDHDLALRLQEEENRAAREHQQRLAARHAQQPRPEAQSRKKSSDCVII